MMVEMAFSLEDACRRAEEMINQLSRKPRENQGQGLLDYTPDNKFSSMGFSSSNHFHNHHHHSTSKRDSAHNARQSIHTKLRKLYLEQLEQIPRTNQESILNKLETECDLLGRLVQKEKLHTLVVNLNPGNKGYSLGVKNSHKSHYDKSTCMFETQLMGYEQGELLNCIDNGQLPAMLAEQLETNHSHLFYDGCIIAEIRDYRKSHPHNKPEVFHVLLKPTTQSLLSDVSTLTSDGDWSHEDRLVLESHIIAATQGPLCLDPNPIPSLATTRLKQSKALLADQQLQRQARKFSQVTVNRKRKLEQLVQSEGLTIQDLMQKLRSKNRIPSTVNTVCPAPKFISPPLPPPTSPIDVLRYAKAYEQPRETKDCLPLLVEEYILETERGQGRIYHIKLTILQRPSNSEYLGELYVDIDYREGERKGSSCRFTLGTRAQANHYIQQFTEIFTEEGRKNVKIQHVIPGQPPRVTCTPGMHRAQQQAQQAQQQQQSRAHQQQQAQLVQQLAQSRVAQQILSRAQGQLNSLAVANTMKAMTSQQQHQQVNLVKCLENNQLIQNLQPTEIVQNDGTGINIVNQRQMTCNGGPINNNNNQRVPVVAAQQYDNSTANVAGVTMDGTPCNGSTGILVFQQKPMQNIAGSSIGSNVPVLQAQLQAGTCSNITDSNNHNSVLQRNNSSTNLAISALANSLMDSAQQFTQQQQAAAAANAAAAAAALNNSVQSATKTNNSAIRSLLNSTPANITQQRGRQPRAATTLLPQRVLSHGNVITVPNTSAQVRVSFGPAIATGQIPIKQQTKTTAVRLDRVQENTSALGLSMPGLSALLAGTPTDDNSIPGITAASTLFERLTASSSSTGSQPDSPMTSPPPQTPPQQTSNINLQSVNLANLPNSINGLQNVQVSIHGLSQPITMSLNVSAGGNVVTPTGVIVSLPISSGTNTCTTVSSMVAATVVTTAAAGTTPTVVIANPGNAHLSLPIAQIIPAGVKGIAQQNMRNANAAVTLYQSGQAIHLVGSPKPRHAQLNRPIVQQNQIKSAGIPNQVVTVAKSVAGNQLILSGNKQVLTPIMAASKPMLMATQAATSSPQIATGNKQTLLAKSLQARAAAAVVSGQCNTQTQAATFASFSPEQLQQIQQCLVAQRKANATATNTISVQNRQQIQPQRNSGDENL